MIRRLVKIDWPRRLTSAWPGATTHDLLVPYMTHLMRAHARSMEERLLAELPPDLAAAYTVHYDTTPLLRRGRLPGMTNDFAGWLPEYERVQSAEQTTTDPEGDRTMTETETCYCGLPLTHLPLEHVPLRTKPERLTERTRCGDSHVRDGIPYSCHRPKNHHGEHQSEVHPDVTWSYPAPDPDPRTRCEAITCPIDHVSGFVCEIIQCDRSLGHYGNHRARAADGVDHRWKGTERPRIQHIAVTESTVPPIPASPTIVTVIEQRDTAERAVRLAAHIMTRYGYATREGRDAAGQWLADWRKIHGTTPSTNWQEPFLKGIEEANAADWCPAEVALHTPDGPTVQCHLPPDHDGLHEATGPNGDFCWTRAEEMAEAIRYAEDHDTDDVTYVRPRPPRPTDGPSETGPYVEWYSTREQRLHTTTEALRHLPLSADNKTLATAVVDALEHLEETVASLDDGDKPCVPVECPPEEETVVSLHRCTADNCETVWPPPPMSEITDENIDEALTEAAREIGQCDGAYASGPWHFRCTKLMGHSWRCDFQRDPDNDDPPATANVDAGATKTLADWLNRERPDGVNYDTPEYRAWVEHYRTAKPVGHMTREQVEAMLTPPEPGKPRLDLLSDLDEAGNVRLARVREGDMPLPPFDDHHPCPKCGWEGRSASPIVPSVMGSMSGRVEHHDRCRRFRAHGEHIHRWCNRCRHEWAEAPVDTQ